jgi:Tfp pilus assembly protein PilP
MTSNRALALAGLLGVLNLVACGGDEPEVTQQRGMGGAGVKIDNKAPPPGGGGSKAPADNGSRRSTAAGEAPAENPEAEPPRPNRPKPVISREDFSSAARDPFHTYVSPILDDQPAPVEVLDKQRNVKLSEYDFEELKLIAIVNAGRNVEPRALFVSASDKKSKTVRQGEYFSSAEVLLASVNRDYIEIEIMDPELTPGWNMERGERRVIYLKDPGKQPR